MRQRSSCTWQRHKYILILQQAMFRPVDGSRAKSPCEDGTLRLAPDIRSPAHPTVRASKHKSQISFVQRNANHAIENIFNISIIIYKEWNLLEVLDCYLLLVW